VEPDPEEEEFLEEPRPEHLSELDYLQAGTHEEGQDVG
jgi:hypothetical protein